MKTHSKQLYLHSYLVININNYYYWLR